MLLSTAINVSPSNLSCNIVVYKNGFNNSNFEKFIYMREIVIGIINKFMIKLAGKKKFHQ